MEWLMSQDLAETPEEALMIGNLLVLSNIITPLGNQVAFEGKKKEFWAFVNTEVPDNSTTTTTTNNASNSSSSNSSNNNTGNNNDPISNGPKTTEVPMTPRRLAKRSTSFLSGVRQRIDKEKKSSPMSNSDGKATSSSKKHRSLGSDAKDVLAPLTIKKSPFGSLAEMMSQQKEKHPNKEIPVLLEMLCKAVIDLGGCKTEGIFRISAHSERVRELKAVLQKGDYNMDTILSYDVHEVANMLKQILRELSPPLIPEDSYNQCLEVARTRKESHIQSEELWTIIQTLPAVNQAVIEHLFALLRTLASPESIAFTKMSAESLGVAFAPVFLRYPLFE